MPIIQDEEFGKVTIRRSRKATQIKLRVAPDGTLRASLPMRAPIFLVKHLLKSSRLEIRKILNQAKPEYHYVDGMQIGKSHTLIINRHTHNVVGVSRNGHQISVKLPMNYDIDNPLVSRKIREEINSALRVEARSYLPKRICFLSQKHSLSYKKIRFSHASGRWGSCSSSGTISLNIALMKLPFEIIDYVIIHELSHTIHMNHGPDFWNLVYQADPNYRKHRRYLKSQNPTI